MDTFKCTCEYVDVFVGRKHGHFKLDKIVPTWKPFRLRWGVSEDTHFGDKRLTSFFRGNRVDIEKKENGGVFLILFLSTKGEEKKKEKKK